ncbi:MAG: DUF5107 domain-containing protein [Victivallaceae bacterium]|nr:DUF5107 domain-containing protein [Victivallaceae bacterium]
MKVKVKSTTLKLVTYSWAEEDIEPPLLREFTPRGQPIYPYTTQEKISHHGELKEYKAVIFENPYLKLTFLPELNGRLYAAYDKVNRKDLFYSNPQLKPSLFGLRGAWCATGVEYNFPNSHSFTTLEPVDYKIIEHNDGSASFLCGNCDRTTRMAWSVEVILRPESAAVEMVSKLYNRTEFPKRFYYWLNAAVPLYGESQFIYPESTTRLYTHPPMDISQIARVDYPVHKGVDISIFKNIPQHFPVFAETMDEDFFGIYHHNLQSGLVHFADHSLVRGRKIWVFGNSRDGKIWIDKLTDSGLDYCELQTGPFSLQSDYRLLRPGKLHVQRDVWYPVGALGGFNTASRHLAANIRKNETGRLLISLSSVQKFTRLSLFIYEKGKVVHNQTLAIEPLQVENIELPSNIKIPDGSFRVEVRSQDGNLELEYSSRRQASAADGRQIELRKTAAANEISFLRGRYREEQGYAEKAVEEYEKTAGSISCRLALAFLEADSGLWDNAAETVKSVLATDRNNPEALYLAGLCMKRQGNYRDAERYFSACCDNAAFISNALLQLAEISILRKNYPAAYSRLFQLYNDYAVRSYPLALMIMVLRKMHKAEDAARVLAECGRSFPFEPLIAGEKYFLAADAATGSLRPLQFLETVCSYIRLRIFDDASSLLKLYISENGKTLPPVFYYLAGHVEKELGQDKNAAAMFSKGAVSKNQWLFPDCSECAAALEAALAVNKDDAAASYHLGCFYAFKRRWKDAFDIWEKVRDERYKALSLRCQGLYLWKIAGELRAAARKYENAVSVPGYGAKTVWEFDLLLAELGQTEQRLNNLRNNDLLVTGDGRLLLRRAAALLAAGKYEATLDILKRNTFHLCEGKSLPRIIFEDAVRGLGEKALQRKDKLSALEYFRMPLEYPENLGVGKPAENMVSEWHWRCGNIIQETCRPAEAAAYFAKGAEKGVFIEFNFFPLKDIVWEHSEDLVDAKHWINLIYRALCMGKTGDTSNSKRTLRQVEGFLKRKKIEKQENSPEIIKIRKILTGNSIVKQIREQDELEAI